MVRVGVMVVDFVVLVVVVVGRVELFVVVVCELPLTVERVAERVVTPPLVLVAEGARLAEGRCTILVLCRAGARHA